MSELVGLKFPFAVSVKGGLNLVKQTKSDSTIFDDKIEQLLNTGRGERTMECGVFAGLDTFVFEPNDRSTHTLLEYQIKQAILNFIPEITVISVSIVGVRRTIYAYITYKVNAYGTQNTTTVKVGDIN